jgi:hypothetical protein
MQKLSEVARVIKLALGVLLIVSFFLPWVAQTPSCMDRSVIIRDNISGYRLAVDGDTPQVLLAPAFGAVVGALALALRGARKPLARSLVSITEIPVSVLAMAYIDLTVRLFTPYVVRYGYVVSMVLFWAVAAVSSSEVVIHFPRLSRTGKIIVASAAGLFVAMLIIDYLSRLFN